MRILLMKGRTKGQCRGPVGAQRTCCWTARYGKSRSSWPRYRLFDAVLRDMALSIPSTGEMLVNAWLNSSHGRWVCPLRMAVVPCCSTWPRPFPSLSTLSTRKSDPTIPSRKTQPRRSEMTGHARTQDMSRSPHGRIAQCTLRGPERRSHGLSMQCPRSAIV